MLKVMLDPGHGKGSAHNRGFVKVSGFNYCNEGDCNYLYANNYLKPALESLGIQVGMTRKYDYENPDLATRGKMAKGYDLFISLHSNGGGGTATGTEIWDSTNPKESIKPLCDNLSSAISKAIGTNNRGTKYRKNKNGSNYYGVLRYGLAKHNFIIEHAFHDNPTDAKKYTSNLNNIAIATANTIASYYGIIKPNNPTKPIKPTIDPQDAFIKSVWTNIKGQKFNILPSVTIAQAILESNWGRSELATKAHNLFGIKASKEWTGGIYSKLTWEQDEFGQKYSVEANFRKYISIKDSIIDHDDFFVSTEWRKNNYKRVLEATNYKDQCKALQACGYATDKEYANKLINLIERLGLQLYDKGGNPMEHWAEKYFEELKKKGIEIHEKRFDDPITRGELFSLLCRILEKQEESK